VKVITRWGYEWMVRDGSGFVAGDPWSSSGVTVYNRSGRQLVGLNAAQASAGIQLLSPLGWGTYTVEVEGRLDALDPMFVAAVWLYNHDSDRGGSEIDFEVNLGGNPANPQRARLGMFDRAVQVGYREFPISAATRHRIMLHQTAGFASLLFEAWDGSRWIGGGHTDYMRKIHEGSTLRIGLWRQFKELVAPSTQSIAPRIAISHFEFNHA
jgi:hypothetical protein